MLKLSSADTRQMASICNALSTELRVAILMLLENRNMNVIEIAAALNVSVSTIAANVRILEESGLVITEFQPAKRGSMKVCSKVYKDIYINLGHDENLQDADDLYILEMPIGMFSECSVAPTCGMADENGYIGEMDDPSTFFMPERSRARIMWIRQGYVEYLLPVKNPLGRPIHSIELEYEICSEAPGYDNDWKSDITLWLNGVEVGDWQSPGDFGDRPGRLNPQYWGATANSQYGLLNRWMIDAKGSHFFGKPVSSVTIHDIVKGGKSPYIRLRLGVKDNALNKGGLVLYGRGFGDHDIAINMRVRFGS
jgi:predicted transcriptional regulator